MRYLTTSFLVIFAFSGCSQSFQTTPAPTQTKVAEEAAIIRSDVEIVWQVPEEPVDSFTLYYGYSEDTLEYSVTVETNNLEVIEDPEYGDIFRYILGGVLPEKTVFVAIAAQSNGELSERSEVFAIEALTTQEGEVNQENEISRKSPVKSKSVTSEAEIPKTAETQSIKEEVEKLAA